MRIDRFIAAVVPVLLLSAGGCALINDGSPNLCPTAAILDGPGELVRFATGPSNGPADVSFRAKMKGVSGLCEMDEKSITMELNVPMEALRGPANTKGEAQFAYFVAILDKEKKVLSRIKFPMIAKFQRQETKLEFSEAVSVTIPKKKEAMPQDYMVYIGYEMTPEELAYNRERLRSR